jgi:DNA uptake protein ComE-like DNA-binding protein
MPAQRLKPLESILNFSYYDDEALDKTTQINPNTATIEMLAKIPFVNSSLAQKVVQNRLSSGSYRNLVDFQQRLNLPAEIIAQLMYYLRF